MAKQKVTLTDNSIKSGVTSDANKAMTKTMASVRFHNGICRMRSVYLEGNGVIVTISCDYIFSVT